MRILLSILLGAMLLTSCGKKRSIHITAVNAATGQPYAGLEYTVGSSFTGNDGEKSRKEATGFLDANGEAGVTIKVKSNRTYYVHVKEPANTCYNKMITMYFDSPFDKDGHFNFEFAECAYLKLNINNVNCQGAADDFKLYHYGSDVGFGNISQGNPIKYGEGCYSYLGSDFSSVPMGGRYYRWEVTRNNITTTFYDTINLSAGEYKIYDIDY